ncbi:hypothetical protein O181_064808 [Austropuccinia psidii MF-1]|uniref:Uncharacterized protein n=1 Tax=Austropuccinia psidii MF-1 TaxID=1389203 RepID=A0A9Q3ENM6_9BASI|nr:hypothetical protein [Austropuccinia psidii MF-1]
MVSSHQLGIEVGILEHKSNPAPPLLPECEHRFILNICNLSKPHSFFIAFISAQPPRSQKPNFERYEKENTVAPCGPTEEDGQDDVIFSGEVENISKESLERIQNDSKTPYYVHKKIAEAME